jgi:hypothetical protein
MADRRSAIVAELERFIRWAYEHARLHEEDLRQALATAGPSESR